jgi:hypothetical protein
MGMIDILGRYADPRRPYPPAEVEHDFDEVLTEASPDTLEDGIAEAFRSEETAPFEQMVAQLFEHSDPPTRAGLLDSLLAGLGPVAIAGAGRGELADVWRRYAAGARVAPDRAAQVNPLHVEEVARQARQQNPGVLERVSRFYARHPGLVRSLGNVAMGIVLSRMARRAH